MKTLIKLASLTSFFAAIADTVSPQSSKKSSFFKKIFLFACLLIMTGNSYSANYIVSGATVVVIAHSRAGTFGGEAHQLNSLKPIFGNGPHPLCSNSVYIDFDDKELFATALAASLTKQPINFGYEDTAPEKNVIGFGLNRCKVYAIWFQ